MFVSSRLSPSVLFAAPPASIDQLSSQLFRARQHQYFGWTDLQGLGLRHARLSTCEAPSGGAMSESFGAKVAALKRAAANRPRPTAQAPLKPAQARTNLKRVAPESPKIIEDTLEIKVTGVGKKLRTRLSQILEKQLGKHGNIV